MENSRVKLRKGSYTVSVPYSAMHPIVAKHMDMRRISAMVAANLNTATYSATMSW